MVEEAFATLLYAVALSLLMLAWCVVRYWHWYVSDENAHYLNTTTMPELEPDNDGEEHPVVDHGSH